MNSTLIDVALALALSFAAVAAVSSAILEIWARAFAVRADFLAQALGRAFDSPELAKELSRSVVASKTPASTERSLWQIIFGREARLSGVAPNRFLAVALDHIQTAGFFTGAPAAPWLEKLRGDRVALAEEMKGRFDAAVQAASDRVRQRSTVVVFALGFLTAWTFNVDALAIAERTYDASRSGHVLFATSQTEIDSIVSSMRDRPSAISDVNGLFKRMTGGECRSTQWPDFARQYLSWLAPPGIVLCSPADLSALVGWLLTALFAAPGAKFWYDVIASLTRYRAQGR